MNQRKIIFEIINEDRSIYSSIYKTFMLISIIVSILPLTMIEISTAWVYSEYITTTIFIVDYFARFFTADIKTNKGALAFLYYPFTPMAIIDLLSILPTFNVLGQAFKIARFSRLIKIFRLLKFVRYSKKLSAFFQVLDKEKHILLAVLLLSIFYIFISALIMFNVESRINPETGALTFTSFFDALYWATITLTTVGYGDLCPVTNIGRFICMLSSLFGVAIIALPSGVITASYLEELRKKKGDQ